MFLSLLCPLLELELASLLPNRRSWTVFSVNANMMSFFTDIAKAAAETVSWWEEWWKSPGSVPRGKSRTDLTTAWPLPIFTEMQRKSQHCPATDWEMNMGERLNAGPAFHQVATWSMRRGRSWKAWLWEITWRRSRWALEPQTHPRFGTKGICSSIRSIPGSLMIWETVS